MFIHLMQIVCLIFIGCTDGMQPIADPVVGASGMAISVPRNEAAGQAAQKAAQYITAQRSALMNEKGEKGQEFHESYMYAHALEVFLRAHPQWVRFFASGEEKRAIRAVPAEHSLEEAFDAIEKILFSDELKQRICYTHLSYRQYKALQEEYKQKPFFLFYHGLRECICASCPLSRSFNPEIRAVFEQNVVAAISRMHPTKNDKISLVDFASGNLFQSAIIIASLAQEGYKKIRMTLIDQAYTQLLSNYKEEWLAKIKKMRGKKDFTRQVHIAMDMVPSLKEKLPKSDMDKLALVEQTIMPCLRTIVLNNSMVSLYEWSHSLGVNLDLAVYDSLSAYQSDCIQQPLLKNDLVMIADFEDKELASLETISVNFVRFNVLLKNSGAFYAIYFQRGKEAGVRLVERSWCQNPHDYVQCPIKRYQWDGTKKLFTLISEGK